MLALSDAERRVARRLAQVPAHHGCTVERLRALALQRQLSERIAAERDAILGKVEDSDVAALLESLAGLVARLR